MTVTMADHVPQVTRNALITFMAVLIVTKNENMDALFWSAEAHRLVVAEDTGLPVCGICGTWVCDTYRDILIKLVREKFLPPESLPE